ncbi:hypothetical protein HK101_003195 [Irineochytrium annulatum]|nr:hypothetical protein HK101_003195 [Irineochytrium annulatum]
MQLTSLPSSALTKRKLQSALDAFDLTLATDEATVRVSDAALAANLATFKSLTWFDMPDYLAPPVCAARGWQNEGVDTLVCPNCGARLSVSTGGGEAELRRVGDALVAGHALACVWRSKTAPLYVFPRLPYKATLRALQTRLDELLHINLPPLEARMLAEESDPLVALVERPPSSSMEWKHFATALALASHGWEREGDAQLKCHMCFRIVACRAVEAFDPVEEHK